MPHHAPSAADLALDAMQTAGARDRATDARIANLERVMRHLMDEVNTLRQAVGLLPRPANYWDA
ncbi:MAG TPA: hypothetical protein VJQ42_02115 [Rhodanobacteraceae bacterium]|nr:hypothetical protein [Rhodanobacteraceae bacterium]